LDPFSLLLAREANIATTDTALAQQLHDELIREIEIGGKAYTRELWANRSLGARLLSWSVFGLARFVMGIVGLGRGLN
jgi:cardiolipin synthase A/B